MIQEQSNKKQGQKISVQVPVDVATFLLNEKREIIIQTELEGNNKIFIIANKYFDVPQFKITSSDLGNKKELSYQEVDIPDVENLDDNEHETKDKQIPAVKGVIPEKRSRKSKNKSLFGFIKGLIASDDTTEKTSEAASDINKESSQDVDGSEGNKKPYRNNRRRRNNRSRNYRSNQQNQENVNKKPEMVMVETPVDVEKNSDKNSDSVNKPKVKPKGNQSKKKAEELKDVNLADVGLKLVETEKKSNQDAPQDDQVKKPARRKKASWAMSEKTAPKKTEKLVMVETKDAPKKSTKTAKAKTSAPKKSTKKNG